MNNDNIPINEPKTDPESLPGGHSEIEDAEIIMPDDPYGPSGPPVVPPAHPNEPVLNPSGPVVPYPATEDDGEELPTE